MQVFDGNGNFLKSIERLSQPSECWCDGRHMYLIEGFGYLSVYDFEFRCVARMGHANSLLSGAHSITGDENGNLYVGFISGPVTLMRLNRI